MNACDQHAADVQEAYDIQKQHQSYAFIGYRAAR